MRRDSVKGDRVAGSVQIRMLVVTVLLVGSGLALGAGVSAGGGTPGRCVPADTEILIGRGVFGLGHWGFSLVILDPGGASCSFIGYPTVKAHLSTGHWLTARLARAGYLGGLGSGQSVERIPVNLYTVASFLLEGTNFAVHGPCPVINRLYVSLPGWPVSANLAFNEPGCDGFEVHPIVDGPTGNQPAIP